MKMGIFKSLLQTVIISCFFVVHCKSVDLTLGVTKEHYVLNTESLLIECILNSGTLDLTLPRTWTADAVTLIADGLVTSAGSGYSETLGTDRFSLTSPPLDYNADGRLFQCNYGFSQGSLNVKIYGIESTDQSKEDCINEKSIQNCWFSLGKVIPEVSSSNLTVFYEDGTMDDINSMLNITSTLNADGKTRAYHFKIESSSFSKDVKEIKLTFIVGLISRTLTIKVKDCSQDIFLYGFLPVFLIVLIASIAIIIPKIDFLSKQFGEFAWKKVGITAVFCVIAIIIGVCLGLLIKGCDRKLLALGLSLFFGILLVVALIFALIYYHKKCESGSDIQDGDGGEDSNRSSQNNTGSNTTRTGTGRVGSPASTSNVELAANLNRNKTDVPKGDQSALNQKAWQSPLPLPPVASQPPTASTHNLPLSRNNQLGPIAVENEEANSSEKKKKKKKKKKKRIVDEAEDNENES